MPLRAVYSGKVHSFSGASPIVRLEAPSADCVMFVTVVGDARSVIPSIGDTVVFTAEDLPTVVTNVEIPGHKSYTCVSSDLRKTEG
jgi:hypothetical protein